MFLQSIKVAFDYMFKSFYFMQRSFHYLSLSSHICVIGLSLCIIVIVIFDRECCILRKFTWYHNDMSTIINGTNVSIDLHVCDKYYNDYWGVLVCTTAVTVCKYRSCFEASITTSAGFTTVSISDFTNH